MDAAAEITYTKYATDLSIVNLPMFPGGGFFCRDYSNSLRPLYDGAKVGQIWHIPGMGVIWSLEFENWTMFRMATTALFEMGGKCCPEPDNFQDAYNALKFASRI